MAAADGLVRKMRMGGGSYLSIYVLSPKTKQTDSERRDFNTY